MILFKKITIDDVDLKEIQNDCRLVLSQAGLPDHSHFYYLEEINDRFQKIQSLKNLLIKLNLSDYWILTAIIILYNDAEIHVDSGEFNYSLVIPLQNNQEAYTVFYESMADPVATNVPTEDSYTFYEFAPENCREISRVEITMPTLINVKVPHGVTVNQHTLPRLCIVCRLHKTFDINKWHFE